MKTPFNVEILNAESLANKIFGEEEAEVLFHKVVLKTRKKRITQGRTRVSKKVPSVSQANTKLIFKYLKKYREIEYHIIYPESNN